MKYFSSFLLATLTAVHARRLGQSSVESTGFYNTDGVLAWMVKDASQEWGYKLNGFTHNNGQNSAFPNWSGVGSQPWDITQPHTVLSATLLRHDILQPVFGSAGHGGILASMDGSGEQWKMMAVGRACFKDHCLTDRDNDYNHFNPPGTCSNDDVQSLVSVCSDRMYGQLQGDPRQRWVDDRDQAVNHQKGQYTGVWNEFHGMAVSPRDVIGIFYPRYENSPNGNWAWDNSSPAPDWALNACAKLKEMSANHLGSQKTKWPVYEYTLKGDGSASYDNWIKLQNSGDRADLKQVGEVSC
jgi:hypothetical protein